MFVIIKPAGKLSTRVRYMTRWSRPSSVTWTYDSTNRMRFESIEAAEKATEWILGDVVYDIVSEENFVF